MNSASPSVGPAPAHPSADEISRRAYQIWESEGHPEGCDQQHWLQAERELKARPPAAAPEPSPQPRVNPEMVDREMRRNAPTNARKRESLPPFSSRKTYAGTGK